MVSGPTEEEGIPDVEEEEVEKNEEEEVKEMRLTFDGFELVCEVGPPMARIDLRTRNSPTRR